MIKAAEWLTPCPRHWKVRFLGSLVEVPGGAAPSVVHSDYWNEIFKLFELRPGPDAEIDRRYFAYLLYVINDNLVNNLEKVNPSLKDLRLDAWRRIPVALPPIAEQRRIADFIENKSIQLDALLDKKQELLPLFQEKRQAFIRQAVTRGLNRSVSLKESGIPGLGAVPSHWRVKRLKHLSPRQLAQYDINQSEFQSSGPYLFDSTWLYHALTSQIERFPGESVKYRRELEQFNVDRAVNVILAVPPLTEQCLIGDKLKEYNDWHEELMNKLELQITRLREYRLALISAAVTGQIERARPVVQ